MLKYIAIIVVIIIILSGIKQKQINDYDAGLEKKDIDEMQFRTGDIIFFRHDCPIYFYGDNGINMDIHIVKNICKPLFHFNQKYFW